ncbi:hypothetical protein JTB14_018002 [Gonioctena quinquepunctata]|nr:hypothetical protein JTB14_018002 [Gonioctena quinquepunctata]
MEVMSLGQTTSQNLRETCRKSSRTWTLYNSSTGRFFIKPQEDNPQSQRLSWLRTYDVRTIQPLGEILSVIVFTKLMFILGGHLDIHLFVEAIALQDWNGHKNSRTGMQMDGLQLCTRMNEDLEDFDFIQILIEQEFGDALKVHHA